MNSANGTEAGEQLRCGEGARDEAREVLEVGAGCVGTHSH